MNNGTAEEKKIIIKCQTPKPCGRNFSFFFFFLRFFVVVVCSWNIQLKDIFFFSFKINFFFFSFKKQEKKKATKHFCESD